MYKETFNPSDSKYLKVEDLPKEEQKNFVNVPGGFVRKEARETLNEAEIIAELANQLKKLGTGANEVLKTRSRSGMLRDIRDAFQNDKTAMDILREGAEKNSEPVNILQEEANNSHDEKYPEAAYLERLRKNPDVLTGIPKWMWKNREFALEAARLNGKVLQKRGVYGDVEIALEAVKCNGLALQWAADNVRANKEVVLEAVKQNPEAIKFASRNIKEAIRNILQVM